MADLYSLVKKQDEKIDDLLKTVKENKDLLTDIDTRLASAPEQTEPSVSAIPERIQVELPSNIATKENVYGAVNQALKNQTDYTAQAITKVCSGFMLKSPSPSPSTPALSDEQIRKIAQEGADKAVDKRYEKLDAAADTVLHRIYNLVHGAIWAAILKWAYTVFAIAVLAAGGFGYGFFLLLNETSKLKDVEWLYRYERGLNRDINTVIHRERLMLHGKPHEVDSMKSLIRHHEQRTCTDTTYTYYYPSNP